MANVSQNALSSQVVWREATAMAVEAHSELVILVRLEGPILEVAAVGSWMSESVQMLEVEVEGRNHEKSVMVHRLSPGWVGRSQREVRLGLLHEV